MTMPYPSPTFDSNGSSHLAEGFILRQSGCPTASVVHHRKPHCVPIEQYAMFDNYKFRDLDTILPHPHPFDAINGTPGHSSPAVVVLGDYLTGNLTDEYQSTRATGVALDAARSEWLGFEATGLFYTTLGHRPELFETPDMAKILLAGIQFAVGDPDADNTLSAK